MRLRRAHVPAGSSPAAIALTLATVATRSDHAGRLAAANNDADAGTWQMIVLTGPTQFTVAPPSSVTSLDYQAELAAIKSAQARLTE